MLGLDTLRNTGTLFGRLRDLLEMTSSKTQTSESISSNAGSDVTKPDSTFPTWTATSTITATTTTAEVTNTSIATTTMSSQQTTQRPTRVFVPIRARQRHPRKPQENSLHYLLRQHPSIGLFTKPVCWTSLHVDLLNARFVKLPPCDTPHPAQFTPRKYITKLSPDADALCRNLNRLFDSLYIHNRAATLSYVVNTLYPQRTIAPFGRLLRLHVYFGGRPYRFACPVELLWCRRMPAGCEDPDRPLVAYLSKDLLLSQRRERLYAVAPGPGGTPNDPVANLVRLRTKRIIPSDPDVDPYIVAVFIAMAQRWFYKTQDLDSGGFRAEFDPDYRDTKFRVLTCDDAEYFSVYTATVTADFLHRFHSPHRAPPEGVDAGMVMEHTKVPVWPVLGLKERLGKALGKDLVGEFDENDMETWEARPEDETSGSGETSGSDTEVCSDVERVLNKGGGSFRKRNKRGRQSMSTEASSSALSGSASSVVSEGSARQAVGENPNEIFVETESASPDAKRRRVEVPEVVAPSVPSFSDAPRDGGSAHADE